MVITWFIGPRYGVCFVKTVCVTILSRDSVSMVRLTVVEKLGGVISIMASSVSESPGIRFWGSSSLRGSSGSLVPKKVSRAL